MITKRGYIQDFKGSWGSGIATLTISGKPLLCENAPTVRALEDCFGGVITENHGAVIPDHAKETEVVYSVDDLGMLVAFTPVDKWEGPEIPEEGITESETPVEAVPVTTAPLKVDWEDIETYEPKPEDIVWFNGWVGNIKEGGEWLVPRSGNIYRISHAKKTITCIRRCEREECIDAVARAAGWTVGNGK